MKLETERLILRNFGQRESDVRDLVEGCNDLEVTKWLLMLPYPYREEDALWWIDHCKENLEREDRDKYEFAIELKDEKKLIGGVGLSSVKKEQGTATIDYWLNSNYHQKGYGSEAVRAVLDFAFNGLKLRRIDAGVFPGNPSSGKLLEKFGAKKEGLKRESKICKADGKIKDEITYGLLRKEYKQ